MKHPLKLGLKTPHNNLFSGMLDRDRPLVVDTGEPLEQNERLGTSQLKRKLLGKLFHHNSPVRSN